MRWEYLVPRVFIAILFWGIFHFGFDPALKKVAVLSTEMVMDSKVDLDQLGTSFFPPEIEMKHVAVADSSNPGFNLLEFDNLELKLEGQPLLQRSYIINEASLTGLRFGTIREDSEINDSEIDFSLPSIKVESFDISLNLKKEDWMKGIKGHLKNAIDPKQLESVRLAKIKQIEWKNKFSNQQDKLEQLKNQLDQIKHQVKGTKGNALEKLQVYHDAAMNAKQLRKQIKAIRNELRQLPSLARTDYEEINQARLRDQKSLKDKTQILKLDPKAISQALLGPALEERMQQSVNYLSWLKENFSDKMEIPEPDRFRGMEIQFRKKEPLPKYLCRLMNVSGMTEISGQEFNFSGTIQNLTSDPKLYQTPLMVEIKGEGQDNFLALASIDLSQESPSYQFNFEYHQKSPTTLHLGQGSELAFDLSAAWTELTSSIEIKNGKLEGQIQLEQSHCQIELIEKNKSVNKFSVAQTLQPVLQNIDSLQVNLDLNGTIDSPEWNITSNLGEHLANGMTNIFADEFEKQKTQMAQMINENALKELKQFETLLNGEYSQISSLLNLQEKGAQELIQKIAGGKGFKLDSIFR